MRELKVGMRGNDVSKWQLFLCGLGMYLGNVDGIFGPISRKATVAFQIKAPMVSTGVVDPCTLGHAVMLGFDPLGDDDPKLDPGWPARPTKINPIGVQGRRRLFGTFQYTSTPVANNPEAITILGDWAAKNIVKVTVPRNKTQTRSIWFHRKGADKLRKLFNAWQKAGLLSQVKTFDGGWVPRFIRGSRVTLSNHAFGTAFDINARWNSLGAVPAIYGETGSVRGLVGIANDLGFFWGGHYAGRKDGMHFELVKL